jgi:tetratricopeptide (TPR) repeat protein
MDKILKKYTTIPAHLYVNRSADEQLERIVDEMQRPGYVLVARQMGKTNLLFNAKRTLENKERLFVYVDLSNPFEHERDCYRNIIDNVIEPNESLFESIESDIYTIRDKGLPPHKEYSNSLRVILKHYTGDVVIVLDEIDALRSADYSDNIFAQIRSNYFSRTNFPVFERLTYILSGVIDPIELIKDRNKSPFNIGDKIYLDDFTKDEHKSFIEKSKLELSDEISDEIYNWASGSPRLTFDICSEIESLVIEGTVITVEVITNVVNKKYLTAFDVAPVDNIRELVKSHRDVRTALLKISNNKSNELSDDIKKKLYLYGIINSEFDKKTEIKNRVIKLSLLDEWINTIDKEVTSLYIYGMEKLEQGNYEDAMKALIEYSSDLKLPKEQLESCFYNIGISFLNLNKFNESKEYFSKVYHLDSYKFTSKYYLGVSLINLGDSKSAIEVFENIIDQKRNDFSYRHSIIGLAPLIENNERVIELYEALYNSTYNASDVEEEEAEEEELNTLRVVAKYYSAQVYINNKQNEEAQDAINLALNYSSLSESLYLKRFKYILQENKDEQLKQEIVNSIISNKLKFDGSSLYPFCFNKENLIIMLAFVYEPTSPMLFSDLLNYSESNLLEHSSQRVNIAFESSKFATHSAELLNYILDTETAISGITHLNIYRALLFHNINNEKEYFNVFNKYRKVFEETNETKVEDIHLFSYAVQYIGNIEKVDANPNQVKFAINLCDLIISRIKSSNNKDLMFDSIIIYYWLADLNYTLNDKDQCIYYANKTLENIENSKDSKMTVLDETGLKTVTSHVTSMKNAFGVKQTIKTESQRPIVKEKRYGRNEIIKVKYSGGDIVEGKYKKLEKDIIAEKCELI